MNQNVSFYMEFKIKVYKDTGQKKDSMGVNLLGIQQKIWLQVYRCYLEVLHEFISPEVAVRLCSSKWKFFKVSENLQ